MARRPCMRLVQRRWGRRGVAISIWAAACVLRGRRGEVAAKRLPEALVRLKRGLGKLKLGACELNEQGHTEPLLSRFWSLGMCGYCMGPSLWRNDGETYLRRGRKAVQKLENTLLRVHRQLSQRNRANWKPESDPLKFGSQRLVSIM
jgi:hypothetical protein